MKECVICNAELKNNWSLKKHIKRMHTVRKCIICEKEYTKHEASVKTNSKCCSDVCRKIHKQNWSKIYGQKPEVKHQAKLNARKYMAQKKAQDPEWNLLPLIEYTCSICNSTFTQRGVRRKFCSDTCYEINRKRYAENKLKEYREATIKRRAERIIDKQCLICKKTFTTSHHGEHKFCSYRCRVKNDNKKHAKTMSKLLHQALYRTMRKNGKSNIWTHFNFTIDEFRERFEFLFTKGMKWENMGLWHIDHIKPKASFNQEQLADPTSEDFKKCWALNNLQPLWAVDNISKGNKWDGVVNA